MYWNISLENGGISRWGWAQNSLVVVDPQTKSYRYTPEYYVMKHVSHYVQPGAYKLETEGAYTNLLAFRNPDNSIAARLSPMRPVMIVPFHPHRRSSLYSDRKSIFHEYAARSIDNPFERCKKTSCQLSLRIFVYFVRNIVSRTRVNTFGTLFA